DVAALRERRAALGDVDARYAAALAAHEAVMSRAGGTAASDLRIVAADIGQAAAELREVDEAIAAERTASDALAEAFSSLQSAGGWSTYDTFFGGGQWPLLTCFLGLAHLAAGDRDRAEQLLDWAAGTANAALDLPEQVAGHLIAPGMRQEWIDRWGTVATPLLWSHAMFLRLGLALGRIDEADLTDGAAR
ncbi:MAG: hypothetical protein J0I50_06990, partial [Microbacterium sp.]|nr:hypothetical protein [Microbacterium sp.]